MTKPASTALKKERPVIIEERFEVITPIFGGGVYIDQNSAHAKKPDELTPVRASSVRGQLRFWWRATQAHHFGSIEELREAEAKLWGAASEPAKVSLEVEANVRSSPVDVPNSPGIAYAAFPLRPIQGGGAPGKLTKVDGKCVLRLRVPEGDASRVREAIDAWLLFGGIGGRTRRGFGAVAPIEGSLNPEQFIHPFKGRRPLAGLSSLGGASLVLGGATFDSPKDALERALAALRDFRQKPGLGRNGTGERDPGRSFWPEPDTIRALTGQSSERHRKPTVHVRKFPRAAFGMPIIFHFKNDREDRQREPGETHLLPRGQDRRASPLIVKPVRISGRFHPLALTLVDPARVTENLILREKQGQRRDHPVESTLDADEVAKVTPLGGERDPLVAFLRFFEKRHAR